MSAAARFLAVDLGASNGRIVVCTWTGVRFHTQEIYRFPNGPVDVAGELCWNAPGIWQHILDGLARYHALFNGDPCGIAVDAWGVDFALLDRHGRLIANPISYRDSRTKGVAKRVFEIVPECEWYADTGAQTMEISTLFQLSSMVFSGDQRLDIAESLVMMPDFFLYLLGGEVVAEYTVATTTQMYSVVRHKWASALLDRIGIRTSLLPSVISPGNVVSEVRPGVLENCGLRRTFPVVAIASHDTASAVAAIPDMDGGSVFISCGTWSLIGTHVVVPDVSERAFSLGFTNEGAADGGTMLLKTVSGLWTLQECVRIWRLNGQKPSWEYLCEAASRALPFCSHFDPDDPCLQVHGNMPELLSSYFRETGQPALEDPSAIARATFESLALKYRATIESLETVTGRVLSSIRIVGGGSLNRLLCQMISDATNRVVVAGPAEASAIGNAMVQAVATGYISGLASGRNAVAASIERTIYEPSPSDAWDETYTRFRRLEFNRTGML